MAEPLIVADTGPLISLSHIDALHVLPALYDQVLIPNAVADELKASRFESVHGILINNPWLRVRAPMSASELALSAILSERPSPSPSRWSSAHRCSSTSAGGVALQ